jgi:hypothetical protein
MAGNDPRRWTAAEVERLRARLADTVPTPGVAFGRRRRVQGDQFRSELAAALEAFAQALTREQEGERCLCAAVLVEGQIIRGHRHDDALQTAGKKGLTMSECVQGFLTSRGRFVDRREGMRLQVAARIASVTGYRGDTLFSEDLY